MVPHGSLSMSNDLRVLFVDDTALDVMFEQHELTRHGISFISRIATSEAELVGVLADFHPDVVLCDYTLPGFSGWRALDMLRRLSPATPILMVSGTIPDDTAIECLNGGAIDYILKSNLRRLGPAVNRAVADSRGRAALEARIERLAHFDALTGLPQLSFLRPAVANALRRAAERQGIVAVVAIELHHFRLVDECLGRLRTDEALRAVGALLRERLARTDFVSRTGSHDFLIVLPNLVDAQEAGTIARDLLDAVGRVRMPTDREAPLGASAGIAMGPVDGDEFEILLFKAEAALQEATAAAPGTVLFHSGDAVQHARSRRRLEADLRTAIEGNGLTLYFQPQFDIPSGEPCGIEALARWFPPGDAAVSPAVFIPLAEQSGLIAALGGWALRASCSAWAARMHESRGAPISVNVSPHQICEQFTADIRGALAASGLPPELLELEITESVLLTHLDLARRCLTQWKDLGVRIALDDFGTGYSSLGYLAKLPIDRLKIDSSLIRGIATESKNLSIVRAVISLGRDLGFTVLAEGVETEEQMQTLHYLGCQQAQGYLMTAPQTAHEAFRLMHRKWGVRATAPGQQSSLQ
jgi:diguanylate cyclase (GGDEF)-like protein